MEQTLLDLHSSSRYQPAMVVIAAEEHRRGGSVLWAKEGTGYTVVVFQMHDKVTHKFTSPSVDVGDYDMVEIRVLSSNCSLKDFWNTTSRRVTHWKRSWSMYCMDPGKDMTQVKAEVGTYRGGEFFDYADYEKDVNTALQNAEETDQKLRVLNRKPVGNQKPWAEVYRQSGKSSDQDKFWMIAVYPDGFDWVVKIHRGNLATFGQTYPRYWELGYRFDDYSHADKFAKDKVKQQVKSGYSEDKDPKTLRVLRWSLREAVEGD